MSVKEAMVRNKQISWYTEFLLKKMTDDYASRICDAIIDDVIEDVVECADEEWSEGDVRLAIGRVLCSRLGIEF